MQYLLTSLCIWHAVCIGPNNLEFVPTGLYRDFFKMTSTERRKHFRDFDLETQYELLIIGSQHVEPPTIELSDELAKSGGKAVPLLRRKLEATKNEATIRDIVMVFRDMQDLGTYDVRHDDSLMSVIEKRVSGIEGLWKSTAQRMLESIKHSDEHGKSP